MPDAHNEEVRTRIAHGLVYTESQVRTAIGPITHRLWGNLPAEDLATAGRVPDRASAVLAGAARG